MFIFILTALAIIPFLFNRRIRQRITVTSLHYFLLLKRDIQRSSAPQRFTLDNWLPILILLLLAAAIVFKTVQREEYKKAVAIIDCSARMQMREGRTTRFQAAIAAAKQKLATAEVREVMIIAAEAAPRLVLPFSRAPQAWNAALDSLQPKDGEADMTAAAIAAATAIGSPAGGPIFLFSDLELPPDFFARSAWKNFQPVKAPSQNRENVAIINFNDGKPIAGPAPFFIAVKNFGQTLRSVPVVTRDNQSRLGSDTLFLDGGQQERVFLRRETRELLNQKPGLFSITLEIDDALPLDNVVFGDMTAASLPHIYLISSRGDFNTALSIFAAHSGYAYAGLAPADFYSTAFGENDLLVFHDFFPENMDRFAAIAIGASEKIAAMAAKHGLAHPSLNHPLLDDASLDWFGEYVSPAAFPVEKDKPQLTSMAAQPWHDYFYVSPPNTGVSLILLSAALFAGSANNQEREQAALKLLFNALELHLKKTFSPASGLYRCGDLIPLQLPTASGAPVQIIKPNGNEEILASTEDAFVSEYAGIYTIAREAMRRKIPVNFLNAKLSSGRPDTTLDQRLLASFGQDFSPKAYWASSRPYAELLLLIIFLLIVDWLYFFRPWRKEAQQKRAA